MRRLRLVIILFLIFLVLKPAFSRLTFFGSSGFIFLPSTEYIKKGEWAFSYMSKPENEFSLISLFPYSVQGGLGLLTDGFEVTVCNIYQYSSKFFTKGVDIVDIKTIYFPCIPSVKHTFLKPEESRIKMGLAYGLEWPYGLFFVMSKLFIVKAMNLDLIFGVATKFITYHAYSGFRLNFKGKEKEFPLALTFEIAWAGSLRNLEETEEAFMAFSLIQKWTENIELDVAYRLELESLKKNREIEHRVSIGFGYYSGSDDVN